MSDIRGKLLFVRSYLADLYEEIGAMPDEVGKGFAQQRVSDAIDDVSAAYMAMPSKVAADAS